jgi:hypothetical protein
MYMRYATGHNSFASQYLLNKCIYCRFCRLCIINVWKRRLFWWKMNNLRNVWNFYVYKSPKLNVIFNIFTQHMFPDSIRIRVSAEQEPNQQNKQIIFKAQIRLQTCTREVLLSNLSPDTDYTDWGFPQFLIPSGRCRCGTSTMLRPLPFRSFPIYLLSILLPFDSALVYVPSAQPSHKFFSKNVSRYLTHTTDMCVCARKRRWQMHAQETKKQAVIKARMN